MPDHFTYPYQCCGSIVDKIGWSAPRGSIVDAIAWCRREPEDEGVDEARAVLDEATVHCWRRMAGESQAEFRDAVMRAAAEIGAELVRFEGVVAVRPFPEDVVRRAAEIAERLHR